MSVKLKIAAGIKLYLSPRSPNLTSVRSWMMRLRGEWTRSLQPRQVSSNILATKITKYHSSKKVVGLLQWALQ